MWGGAAAGVGAYGAQPQQVPQLPSVQAVLDEMYATGVLMAGELDFNVQSSLRGLSEPQAYEVVNKFREANTGGIRNKSAFLSNVIKRIRDTIPVAAMGMGMPGVMMGAVAATNKTVHIGNLPPGATPDVVRQLFSHFGAIVDVRFGGNAKYAFVDYVEPASATAALGMNQYDLWGFRLRVEAASSFRQTGAGAGGAPLAAAYGVGGYAGGEYQQPVDYGAASAAYAAQPAPAYSAPPGPPPGPPTTTDAGNAYNAYVGYDGAHAGQKRPRVGEPGGPEPQTIAEVDQALAAIAEQQAELQRKVAELHAKKEQLGATHAAEPPSAVQPSAAAVEAAPPSAADHRRG